jgi:hypothetical protein
MYTADKDEETYGPGWAILDPDGDMIFMVETKSEAEIALSHLNR